MVMKILLDDDIIQRKLWKIIRKWKKRDVCNLTDGSIDFLIFSLPNFTTIQNKVMPNQRCRYKKFIIVKKINEIERKEKERESKENGQHAVKAVKFYYNS